jgi:hypothetical protein
MLSGTAFSAGAGCAHATEPAPSNAIVATTAPVFTMTLSLTRGD